MSARPSRGPSPRGPQGPETRGVVARIGDALSSRRLSLALMAFLAAVSAIGAWIPQRVNAPPAEFARWQSENPALARVAAALGLDRVFWTHWFSAVLGLFTLALLTAAATMAQTAWRRHRGEIASPHERVPGTSAGDIVRRARARGYRTSMTDGRTLLVRHRLGIWSPVVLHAGMVVSILAGMFSLACSSRAVVDLSAGEVFTPGDAYLVVDGGALAERPDPGSPLRLDGMATEEWEGGDLRSLVARLATQVPDGEWVAREASANRPARIGETVVYVQSGEFGDAAFLVVTGPDGSVDRLRMEFGFTPRGAVSYADVIAGDGGLIEGRWDPHGVRGTRPLALRPAGDDAATPAVLEPGERAVVGQYVVDFVGTASWARLIIARPVGVDVLFAGFGIIALGSLALYLWVPRVLVLEPDGDGVRYTWWAGRMGWAYLSELEALLHGDGDREDDSWMP